MSVQMDLRLIRFRFERYGDVLRSETVAMAHPDLDTGMRHCPVLKKYRIKDSFHCNTRRCLFKLSVSCSFRLSR